MEMTENEIVSKYLRNGKSRNQIEILAELNATSKEYIIEILTRNGAMEVKNKVRRPVLELTDELIDQISELYSDKNYTMTKISEELNIPMSAVRRALKDAPKKNKKELPSQKAAKEADNSLLNEVLARIDSKIATAELDLDLLKADRCAIVKIFQELNL